MTILYIIIFLLLAIILFLSLALYWLIIKSLYFSNKEKEFLVFVIEIFTQYGEDLGIQTKEQHIKLTEELEKIKAKIKK